MSEQEVRELLNIAIDTYGNWDDINEERNKLLAEPPDVVVLLREIEERLIAVDSWLRKNCNLASHDGYVGMQNAKDSAKLEAT